MSYDALPLTGLELGLCRWSPESIERQVNKQKDALLEEAKKAAEQQKGYGPALAKSGLVDAYWEPSEVSSPLVIREGCSENFLKAAGMTVSV